MVGRSRLISANQDVSGIRASSSRKRLRDLQEITERSLVDLESVQIVDGFQYDFCTTGAHALPPWIGHPGDGIRDPVSPSPRRNSRSSVQLHISRALRPETRRKGHVCSFEPHRMQHAGWSLLSRNLGTAMDDSVRLMPYPPCAGTPCGWLCIQQGLVRFSLETN